MCAAALALLCFKRVTFGCGNDKFGGNGSILPIHETGCGGCGRCAHLLAATAAQYVIVDAATAPTGMSLGACRSVHLHSEHSGPGGM